MKTKEIVIDWQFESITEKLDGDWALWLVTGTDEDGNKYFGDCETFIGQPEIYEVTNIEKEKS